MAPTVPDLTLILDLPAELGLGRAQGRRLETADEEPDAYEKRDLAYHWKLREAFAAIAGSEPDRCVLIDAAADEALVADAVWRAVETRLLTEAR